MRIIINGESKTFKDLSVKYKALFLFMVILAPLIAISAVVFAILLVVGVLAFAIPFALIMVILGIGLAVVCAAIAILSRLFRK